jgi:LPS-assembly lipoprotein
MKAMLSRFRNVVVLLSLIVGLTACGFHLRENVPLPPSMKRVHVSVNGSGDFRRMLVRALRSSGAEVEEKGGVGIAELNVPVATFNTDALSFGGAAQVTEYAVHFNVQFAVTGPDGTPVVGMQHILMTREYSYDVTNAIGNASQVEGIQGSLIDDMVQSILFRLQAATKHPEQAKQVDPNAVPPPPPSNDMP